MPICPHCRATLANAPMPGDKCPHCGAPFSTMDEGLAGRQTYELIPNRPLPADDKDHSDSGGHVLDDLDLSDDDDATLPFDQTVEIDPKSTHPDTKPPEDENSSTLEFSASQRTYAGDQTIDEIVIDDSEEVELTIAGGDDSEDSDEDTDEFDVLEDEPHDAPEPPKKDDRGTVADHAPAGNRATSDDHGTVDFDADSTIELPSSGVGNSTVVPPKPVREDRGTVDFDSDKTIDLSSSDPELAAKMSSQWMGTLNLNASAGQTIRQEGGTATIAKQKSTLPVKPRRFGTPANKGTVTYISPSDAPDYELLKQIGEGGMGVVYAARQSSIARKVAVKMLKPGAKSGAEQRDKFISEAVVTGELDHPNIVPIYDLGSNDDGALFYSMKHVQGTPWEDVLAKKTLDENLNILLRVADAVAFAHARGVVHRDLKPENVMLGEFGEVLVMDWGLARVTQQFPNASSIHQSESLGGTPAYMAPEMARGPIEEVDHTSDIYLLGAMLYELIGDRPPHSGRDVMQCLMAAAENVIDPIHYQGELLDVALRSMKTKQAERYQSVKDFQTAVRLYLSHSESLVLAANAERHLSEAREKHDYQLFARAMYGFQESLALWQENAKARQLLTETELAYATQALEGGDLDLAESLLNESEPAHTELLAQIRQAQRDRTARQAMFAWTKRAVAALVVAIVALGTYSYIKIAASNVEISNQRDKAKEQEGIAVANAELAAKNEATAIKNAKEAKRQKDIAESERDEAERLQKEADRLRDIAEKNRMKAEDNERAAVAAKIEAVEARDSEEYEAYIASIGLAAAKIDENAYDFALELLTATPPARRHWEWGRLRYLCELSEAVYSSPAQVDAVAYSPDGKWIASGDRSGNLTVRHADSGEVLFTAPLGQYVYSVAFSPDGETLAAGTSDGIIHRLNASDGSEQATLTGHADGVLDVAFSTDGKQLVSASYDNTARVWDLATGESTATLVGHNWWVWAAQFSPNGQQIVTASQDSNVIVWQRQSDGSYSPAAYFTDHEGPVYAAAFSPTGDRIATGGYDKRVRVWSPDQVGGLELATRLSDGRQVASPAIVLEGHTGAVRSVVFDPADPSVVLSGGHDNTLRLWSLATASEIKTLRGHGSRVESVAMAPDGSHAASASQDSTIRVWNVAGYAESHVLGSRTLAGHADAVLAARFTSDDQVLTASRDRTAKVWSPNGSPVARFAQGHEFLATSAVFIDAGQQLITGAGDNTARVWNVGTGAELQVMRGTGRVGVIAADTEGRYLVTGGTGTTARLWDLATGQLLAELTGHASEVTSAAFADDGTTFATGDDRGTILVWQTTDTGADTLAELTGHSRTITALAFAPADANSLYSASGDNTCTRWQVSTASEATESLLKHPNWVAAMDLSDDGTQLVTACEDGIVRLWDLVSHQVVAQATLGAGKATGVDFAPDGSAVLVTSAGNSKVWRWQPADAPQVDLDQLPPLVTNQTAGTLWTAIYTPDGQRVLTIGGNDARLMDLATGTWGVRFSPHGAVAAVGMSPNGKIVATGSWDGTAKLWDSESQQMIGQLVGGHQGYINSLDFSPNGELIATASDDGTVRLWEVKTCQTVGEPLAAHTVSVHSVRFSSDGTHLLTTSSDHTAKLWDVKTAQVIRTLEGHAWGVLCGEFSRDGSQVVTGSQDNTAKVWNTATGELLATISGHTSAVTSVAFTPDAARVLTGSQDTTAKLWDASNGNEILTLTGHTQDITSVDFSTDGQTALTASRDGTAILWPAVEWKE
ncbi:protein kinase domain-containing protein [Aeoliella mucimassa]|uniref:Serine/threonine-protein kinase PknD n=1 Tax=Aeoliella mucimassa TaxID=2527972 RepID=A0A518AIB1_9BACT|nr:protein kinase [Aeoliella mucimassa]QDU54473.1 Serine/threonine-protein kinase PknD [Aeoliella mucimassa]